MKNTIFKKEYIGLFTEYGHGVDTIQHILHSIGYTYQNIDRKKTREHGLSVIEDLLKNDIIHVTFWGKHHDILNHLELNKRQTMLYLNHVWNEGATYMNFEEIINFYFQKWYLNALTNEGINVNTDWDWFGDKFIPNLPNWIDKKRPKK